MLFDVLPESIDDVRSGFGMNTEQPGQSTLKFVLGWVVVEHE